MVNDPGTDSIVVTENVARWVVLNRKRGTFWMDNRDFSREFDAPKWRRAVGAPDGPMALIGAAKSGAGGSGSFRQHRKDLHRLRQPLQGKHPTF